MTLTARDSSAHWNSHSPSSTQRYVGIFIAALISLSSLRIAAETPDQLPNVVIVFADDMGYGDPRCYNPHSKVPTPNIDALARAGMRFTDAHTASAVCTPSRYGLLTGRYPWRSRLPRGIVNTWGQPVITRDRLTLGKILQAKGYATACIGKWHLGWNWLQKDGRYLSERLGSSVNVPSPLRHEIDRNIDFSGPVLDGPTTRGFDFYFGDDVPNFPPYAFILNDRVQGNPTEWMPGQKGQRAGPMLPNWDLWAAQPTITKRALEWLAQRASEPETPFFLYLPLLGPHTPIVPSNPYWGKSQAGPYGDWVHQMDAILGKVIAQLEKADALENTIVIFSSDNGSPARSGQGIFGATGSVTTEFGHVPNAPWRGLKADSWEAGHRVPFIVRWDGRVTPGSVCDETVCLTDVFRTIAEIVGATVPEREAEDSFSLGSLLFEPKSRSFRRPPIVHQSLNGTLSIRDGDWKLIHGHGSGGFSSPRGAPTPPDRPGPIQLYNLKDDPREENNLEASQPSIVRRLKQNLRLTQTNPRRPALSE